MGMIFVLWKTIDLFSSEDYFCRAGEAHRQTSRTFIFPYQKEIRHELAYCFHPGHMGVLDVGR